jgi:hypothetical protein
MRMLPLTIPPYDTLQGLSEDHFMQLRRIESQVHHGEPVDVGAETVKLLVQRLLGQQALEVRRIRVAQLDCISKNWALD